jgi:hypothetical protein
MSLTLQNGYLKIPGHHGEFPPYEIERRWPLGRKSGAIDGNISFEVGKKKLSIAVEELIKKLKLDAEQIEILKEESNLAERTTILRDFVTFKNALEKGKRGELLFSVFSAKTYEDLRNNPPESFLEEVQKIFAMGPISLSHIIQSFELLSKEEFSEYFFVISPLLVEKISLEEDKILRKKGLDETIRILESFPGTSELRLDPRFSHMLDRVQQARAEIRSEVEAHTQPIQKIRLRWLGSNQAIYNYLELDSWETGGDQIEASKRLIACFRNQSLKLDLSDLRLTNLPLCLKKLDWVEDLNISKNQIQDLTPLSGLRRLTTLDLSFNPVGGRDGISHFTTLNKLEQLQSVKLLHMRGSARIVEDLLRTDLKNCDHIEWTDEWTIHRTFSKRPGELLRNFWKRREREFRSLPDTLNQMSLISEKAPLVDDPQDAAVLTNHSLALERLRLTNLDISPLTEKDPHIISWIHRLAIDEGFKGFKKDPETMEMLSKKVPEILQYALENDEFFEKVLRYLLFLSSIHCGDRTIYYFNEIVRRMELFKTVHRMKTSEVSDQNLEKPIPLEEALAIFRKYFPIALIKQVARQSIEERTQTASREIKEELEAESLEIELDFLLRFKERFQGEFTVPLALNNAIFTGTGKETREEFLQAAEQKIRDSLESHKAWIQYLGEDPDWRRYLLKYRPELQSPLEQTEQTFRNEGEERMQRLATGEIAECTYITEYKK